MNECDLRLPRQLQLGPDLDAPSSSAAHVHVHHHQHQQRHLFDRKLIDGEFLIYVLHDWVDRPRVRNNGPVASHLLASDAHVVMTCALVDSRVYRELFSRLHAQTSFPVAHTASWWSAQELNAILYGDRDDDDAAGTRNGNHDDSNPHRVVSPRLTSSCAPRSAAGVTIDRAWFDANRPYSLRTFVAALARRTQLSSIAFRSTPRRPQRPRAPPRPKSRSLPPFLTSGEFIDAERYESDVNDTRFLLSRLYADGEYDADDTDDDDADDDDADDDQRRRENDRSNDEDGEDDEANKRDTYTYRFDYNDDDELDHEDKYERRRRDVANDLDGDDDDGNGDDDATKASKVAFAAAVFDVLSDLPSISPHVTHLAIELGVRCRASQANASASSTSSSTSSCSTSSTSSTSSPPASMARFAHVLRAATTAASLVTSIALRKCGIRAEHVKRVLRALPPTITALDFAQNASTSTMCDWAGAFAEAAAKSSTCLTNVTHLNVRGCSWDYKTWRQFEPALYCLPHLASLDVDLYAVNSEHAWARIARSCCDSSPTLTRVRVDMSRFLGRVTRRIRRIESWSLYSALSNLLLGWHSEDETARIKLMTTRTLTFGMSSLEAQVVIQCSPCHRRAPFDVDALLAEASIVECRPLTMRLNSTFVTIEHLLEPIARRLGTLERLDVNNESWTGPEIERILEASPNLRSFAHHDGNRTFTPDRVLGLMRLMSNVTRFRLQEDWYDEHKMFALASGLRFVPKLTVLAVPSLSAEEFRRVAVSLSKGALPRLEVLLLGSVSVSRHRDHEYADKAVRGFHALARWLRSPFGQRVRVVKIHDRSREAAVHAAYERAYRVRPCVWNRTRYSTDSKCVVVDCSALAAAATTATQSSDEDLAAIYAGEEEDGREPEPERRA